jgi:hypothetical protein
MANYWIGVVSRSHIQRGVEGGFIQLNHGKKAAVQRLKAGDFIAIYSPRTDYPDGRPLQAFTALGRVLNGEVYQVRVSEDFKPYRVDVQFETCCETPIRALIGELSFIKNKASWGAAFKFGYVRIPEVDFGIIRRAMAPVTTHAVA